LSSKRSPAPLLFRLPLHGQCIRVFHFEPIGRAAAPVGATAFRKRGSCGLQHERLACCVPWDSLAASRQCPFLDRVLGHLESPGLTPGLSLLSPPTFRESGHRGLTRRCEAPIFDNGTHGGEASIHADVLALGRAAYPEHMPEYQVKNVEPVVVGTDIQVRVFTLAGGDVISLALSQREHRPLFCAAGSAHHRDTQSRPSPPARCGRKA
jgi:hypothetical protein